MDIKQIINQVLVAIKFDQELFTMLQNQQDKGQILSQFKLILESTLERHNELYWKQEYSHVKGQNEQLTNENRNLRQDLRDIVTENQQLQHELHQQELQSQDLQTTLMEIEDKLNNMQTGLVSQKEQLYLEFENNLNQIQKKYESQITFEQARSKDLENIVSDLEASLQKYKAELNDQQIQNKKRQLTYEKQQLELFKNNKAVTTEQNKIQLEKQTMEQRIKDQKLTNDNLNKKVKGLELKIVNLQEALEAEKRQTLIEVKKVKQESQDEIKQYVKKNKQQRQNYAHVCQKLKLAIHRIFTNVQLEIDNLKSETKRTMEIMNSDLKHLILEDTKLFINLVNKQSDEKIEDVREIMQQHFRQNRERTQKDFDDRIIELNSQSQKVIDNLQAQVNEFEMVNEKIHKELQQIQSELNQMNNLLKQKNDLIQDQQDQVQQLNEKYLQQKKQSVEAQILVEELRADNEQLYLRIQKLDECFLKQTTQLSSHYQDDKQYKRQFEELQQSNQALRKQIQILQEKQSIDDGIISKMKNQLANTKSSSLQDAEEKHMMRLQYIRKY